MDGTEGTATEDIQLPASSIANNEQNYAQTPPRKRRATTNTGESPQIYEQLTPIASVTPSVKNSFFSPMSRDASVFKSPLFMTPSRFGGSPSKSRVIDFNECPFGSPTGMSTIERSPCPSTFTDSSTIPNTPDYNSGLINANMHTMNLNEKVNEDTSTTSNIIESSITPINNRHHSNVNKMSESTPNDNSVNSTNTSTTSTTTPSSVNSSMNESVCVLNNSMNTSGLMNDLPMKCNCKKSKCLKLYCECFSALEYCDGCNCINCLNTHDHEKDREAAIKVTRERNSTAFSPKVCEKSSTSTTNNENPTFIHTKGCRCKKSNCLKKYCECYQHGVCCTDGCKCCECKNRPIDSNSNNNGNSMKNNKKHQSKTPTSSSSSSSRIKISSSSASMISSINSNSIMCNMNDLRLFGIEYPILEIKILEHIWSYLPSDDMIISSKVNKNWLKMAFIMKEKEKQNNYM